MANTTNKDDTEIQYLKKISTERMGDTNIKFCVHPPNILGNGMTTIVYPGYHFGINKPAAVKYIKKESLREEKEEVNELKIWSEMDQSVNVVRLFDSYQDDAGGLYLAMEKAERNFRKQIVDFDPSRDEVITWLYQISNAVEYLHGKGVIHRDIKPDNILMFLQDGNKMVAKLADFGVSRMISGVERTGTFSNAHGTLQWMAPEAIENDSKKRKFKNTKMLDIYALGMTMYFGLSKGQHPYSLSENSEEDGVLTSLVSKMSSSYEISNKLSGDQVAANDLLSKMMERKPEDRPKIKEVLSHCLFWNWEQEQLFLIRVAICLSKKDSYEINSVKDIIDQRYTKYFYNFHGEKIFNWHVRGRETGVDVSELLFNTRKRKYMPFEYGSGESVTSFLKFFRDKYVHYTEMTPNGAIIFRDSDGSFCDEIYVTTLTSICPNLSAILYQVLSQYANLDSLHPLRHLYFPWKRRNDTQQGLAELGFINFTFPTVGALDAGVSRGYEEFYLAEQMRGYNETESESDFNFNGEN